MGADETLRFDIVGDGSGAADAFAETASTADLAAKGARRLQIALDAERKAALTNVDATLSLAAADKLLEEAERELSGEAEKDRRAQDAAAASKLANAEASKRAAAVQRSATSGLPGLGSALKAAGILSAVAFGPQAVGAAVGVAGLATAFGAAAASAGAFGLVAEPMLKSVWTAASGGAAAIAKLPASEQALARQVLGLQAAWTRLQKSEASVIATDLAPWISTATTGISFLRPLVTDAGAAIGYLGGEAKTALQAPFWGTFFRTLGTTGEFSLIGFGQALGHVADGLGHLFVTFAPDIDKLPGLIDKWSGSFDRWASAEKASGLDNFMSKTFSSGNVARLEGALSSAATILGNVAKATGQISPAAFLGLSNALTVLAKLSPGQIEAIASVYAIAKLGGGGSGGSGGNLLAGLGLGGKGKTGSTATEGGGSKGLTAGSVAGAIAGAAVAAPSIIGGHPVQAGLAAGLTATRFGGPVAGAIVGSLAETAAVGVVAVQTQKSLDAANQAMGQFNLAVKMGATASAAGQHDRAQLIADLQGFGLPASTASRDLSAMNTAVQQNGYYSTQAGEARQQLAEDLVKSGMNAKAAAALVNQLSGALNALPASKTTTFNFSLGSVSPNLNTYLSKTGANATVVSSGGEAEIRLATGGILNEPVYGWGARTGKSYLLGESGREAVIPLGGRASAAAVSSGGGGGAVQVVLSWAGNDGPIGQAIMAGIRAEVQAMGGGGANSVQRAFGRIS